LFISLRYILSTKNALQHVRLSKALEVKKMNSIDHPTCVYHALHGTKTVSAHEAELLYKKGWRDSPDPKILYSGFHGKWYKFLLWFRSIKGNESKHWNSFNFVIALTAIVTCAILVLTYIDNNSSVTANNNIETSKE
jgi:hypothetical protein